ncbi:hypothetical protein H6P81_020922 [Aristolochia fimbriata]|uniref:Protein Lines C-terminal domain-containing protein n=1 Tax=Aristolochia fimbriata TaxID=158543 RepID=A0AAV7E065_ARIFI|nr:hypothetical protein H6P81_020922 [Aristolochia fimbriata]
MAGDGLSKICSLTNQLLIPFSEIELSRLTKEQEKQILVSITKVSKRIKELRILSGREDDASARVLCSFKPCKETFSKENRSSLAEIVYMLTRYLSSSSLYVQHSAENILVALSEFLIESGSGWEVLLHLLLASLDAELLKFGSSSALPDYLTLIGLFCVLRNILKYLKQNDEEIEEEYILSFRNSIFNVSWEMLHNVFCCRNGGILVGCSQSNSPSVKTAPQESKDVFLGSLLQLFCSVVSDDGMKEITGDSLDEHPIVGKIRQFIPQLFSWCYCSDDKRISGHISPYFRHKLLVLMIRLNFSSQPQCSTHVLWLKLLKENCGDLLQQPLVQNTEHLDALESSPFLPCVSLGDQMRNLNSHHLQRQTIFLFIKGSFSLINQGMKAGGDCACRTEKDLPVHELGTTCTSFYLMGLSELSGWLQRQLPSSIYKGYGVYIMECQKFASYFVHLFMDEDDLLFRMLLQLLSSPLIVKLKKLEEGYMNFAEMKRDEAYLISNIFNPLHLFHLLLAEVRYDHSVLLDYLISKDTGILCVGYLLRCLRLVCESWDTFLEFSYCGYGQNESSEKKRKFCLIHKLDPSGELELSSTSREGMQSPMRTTTVLTHEAFRNAKQCLLSFKQSVENLHVKNLFPYNPAALLRSFAKFEDLCQKLGETSIFDNRNLNNSSHGEGLISAIYMTSIKDQI